MEIDQKTIKKMPKTDLHVHLDGSVRIPTILELAKQQNVKLPTTDWLRYRVMIISQAYPRVFPMAEPVKFIEDSLTILFIAFIYS